MPRRVAGLGLLLWCLAAPAWAAEPVPTWVFFTDKDVAPGELGAALEQRRAEISPRALARRVRARGDAGVDARDLDVAAAYVDAVLATGARQRSSSRWLNAIGVEADAAQQAAIAALPFVTEVRPVASHPRPAAPPPVPPAPPPPVVDPVYGLAFDQLALIGIPSLHECGLTGAGVVVGVQDTGFQLDHQAFAPLDVIATHDFIDGDDEVGFEDGDPEEQHRHGTSVLSLVAGWDEGQFVGVAPDVSVILSKTEDTSQEEPIEEDWWVEGIEWVEAQGADLMTASLGYFDWYEPEDMDGQTAVTTQASNIALANGLILVNSAGNGGPAPFTLGAPADTDGMISVGAVNLYDVLAEFSSRGPTWDGRLKPDVCAMGVENWVVDPSTVDEYRQGSGTSYSAPMTAGLVALLLQAFPGLGPWEMRDLLAGTASNAETPDWNVGWGTVSGVGAVGLYCTCQDFDADGYYDVECGGLDCDDARPEIHPGAEEICNGFDDDCDGVLFPGEEDLDADTYLACEDSPGEHDCDDQDPHAWPGANEVPYDGIDQDCDGADLVDVDGDGVPGPDEDCDDEDPEIHPGVDEVCDDGVDNDCDGGIDGDDPDCVVEDDGGPMLLGDGCECAVGEGSGETGLGLVLALILALVIRRR